MRTLELLEESLEVAQRMGYQVRHEYLGGIGGGACEYGGRHRVFVDLALGPDEQLDQVAEALKNDPGIHLQQVGRELARFLDLPRAA